MHDVHVNFNKDRRYFEDYSEGLVVDVGSVTVTEQEIIEFAEKYDPQPFHLDPEAAKDSMYGGLIASGWHTASVVMRLYVDNFLSGESSLGSPGLNELRWLKPVRPNDTLHVTVTVEKAKRSRSKPDRGIIHVEMKAVNQNGETAMTMKAMNLLLVENGNGKSNFAQS